MFALELASAANDAASLDGTSSLSLQPEIDLRCLDDADTKPHHKKYVERRITAAVQDVLQLLTLRTVCSCCFSEQETGNSSHTCC